ncbi:MAG: hypothetical protein HYW50_05375 [Candidatus Diapherotrites archaeon]|nr:hypothetical protein [Candidatus Diapherotrites archaeon]
MLKNHFAKLSTRERKQWALSLDYSGEEGKPTLADTLQSTRETTKPSDQTVTQKILSALSRVQISKKRTINEFEIQVIRELYGIGLDKPLAEKEIASRHGIAIGKIRSINRIVLLQMRQQFPQLKDLF